LTEHNDEGDDAMVAARAISPGRRTAAPEAEHRRVRELVRLYRAIGEPNRLRVLRTLASRKEVSCADLRTRLDLSSAVLSHHLSVLSGCGLVDSRKEGPFRFVWVDRDLLGTVAPFLLTVPAGEQSAARPIGPGRQKTAASGDARGMTASDGPVRPSGRIDGD